MISRPSGRVAARSTVRPRRLTAAESTVRQGRDAAPVADQRDRFVHFRPRTVFVVIGILVASFVVLKVLWISRHVLSWIFIALFLALALNPAVDRVERRVRRRGIATGIVYLAALVVV